MGINESYENKYWWLAPKYFDQLEARSPGLVAIESGILILIAIAAFGGNVLVLVAMYRNRALRTTTNLFTLCLAISDIVAATVSMPLSIVPLVRGEWLTKINQYDVRHFACKLQATIALSGTGFSLHIMTLTAVNRYLRVLKPELSRKIFSKNSIAGMALIDLILTLVLYTWPSLAGIARYTFDPRRCSCFLSFYDVGAGEIAARVYTTLNMGASLLIMVYCYARVFKAIRAHQRSVQPAFQAVGAAGNSLRTTVEEIKATRIMFAVFLGFITCWIPVVVIDILSYQRSDPHLPRQPELVFLYCSALSSAVNPAIYGFMNKAIRKEFRQTLRCCVPQR